MDDKGMLILLRAGINPRDCASFPGPSRPADGSSVKQWEGMRITVVVGSASTACEGLEWP